MHSPDDRLAHSHAPLWQRVEVDAAAAIGAPISKKGMLHVYDTGHMLTSEMMGRAGGLLAWSPLSFSFGVNNPGRHRDRDPKPAPSDYAEMITLALARSNVREGDIVFVGSVSGKTPNPVEMALQAKAKGATVVALTSVGHSSLLESEHPSGKRLYEVAGIVLDLLAGYGPAAEAVPGPLRQAVALLAGHWFAERGREPAATLPPAVAEILAPWRRAGLVR